VILFAEPVTISIQANSYKSSVTEKSIAPGKSVEFVQMQSYYLTNAETPVETKWNFSTELKKNEARWNEYLNNYFSKAPLLKEQKKRLAVKSIVTLITNWRSAAKDILHDGVFPSVNFSGFYGVWSWDSWKQAVGLAMFHPSLAKDNIRCMFDYMNEQGWLRIVFTTKKKKQLA